MGQATPVDPGRPKNQRLAAAAGVLLAPFALLAAIVAIWRIANEMQLASHFLFENGALAHWAIWAAAAVVLGVASHRLNRYGVGAHPSARATHRVQQPAAAPPVRSSRPAAPEAVRHNR
jgi:hypothetical protein